MAVAKRQIRFDNSDRVNRLDVGQSTIAKVETTPQGFLKIPCSLTTTGVLSYTTPDGRTVKELRHPDDILRADSLNTLSGAPVTEAHQAMISPDNVSLHSVGFASESVSHDGKLVNGHVVVQRKDAIDKVKSKELVEISPGYTCSIDPTPGEYKGQRYDQRQVNVIYNHVALLPKGHGRSGAEVALRMDAAVSNQNTPPKKGEAVKPPKSEDQMKKIRITMDGITYIVEVPEALAENFENSTNALIQNRTDSKAEIEKLKGILATKEKDLSETKKRLDSATSPAALEQATKERFEVIEKAKALLPAETKLDGLSLLEIKKLVLEKDGFSRETLDSKDMAPAFIEGAFSAIKTAEVPTNTDTTPFPHVPMYKKPEKRTDGKDEDQNNPDAARARMCKRNREAHLPKE